MYFICSSSSGYLQTARESTVSKEDQVKWVRAICHLYEDLFLQGCSHYYGHLDDGPEDPRPLNALCYMFWDLDCLEGAAMFPGNEHLVQPVFDVLSCALKLPNSACAESALHGLGHLKAYQPEKVHQLINAYLASGRYPTKEMAVYAGHALEGCVQ